jgi:hypothetical protein
MMKMSRKEAAIDASCQHRQREDADAILEER